MGPFRTLPIHVYLIQHQSPPGIFGANADTKEPHNERFLWREGIHKHLHHFASQWESNITLFGCLQGIHNKLLAFSVEFPTKTEEATHTREKQRQRKKMFNHQKVRSRSFLAETLRKIKAARTVSFYENRRAVWMFNSFRALSYWDFHASEWPWARSINSTFAKVV